MSNCPSCGSPVSGNVCTVCNLDLSNFNNSASPPQQSTIPPASPPRNSGGISKKMIFAIIIAAVLILASIASYVMVIGMGAPNSDSDGDGIPDDEDAFPDDPNESVDTDGDGIGNNADTDDDGDGIPDVIDADPLDSTIDGTRSQSYSGAIIPSDYIEPGTRSAGNYYFVGYLSNQTSGEMQTFELSNIDGLADITGGQFNISFSDGEYVLDGVINNASEQVDVDDMSDIFGSLFMNIKTSFTSLSVVYGDYTFGIGTTGTDDYIWIAPEKSYPTFFSSVSVEGLVFDTTTLDTLVQEYATSIFGDIDLSKIDDLAQDFSFSFNGDETKFLIVTDLTYQNNIAFSGDVIDTITPDDVKGLVQKLSETFSTSGTDWIEDVLDNLGQGVAIVTEENSTMESNDLWFLFYSLEDYSNFPGICNFEVSKADFTNLTAKIGMNFDFDVDFDFDVNIGIITDVEYGYYHFESPVRGLWTYLETMQHTSTTVIDVEIEGYGIVVDIDSIVQSLGDAFELPETAVDAVRSLTTFKNPAFVLMLDENFPDILNGTAIWEYGTLAIIPDYDRTASGFKYLNVKGVLYDPALYFDIDTDLSHIPLVVVDSYSEVIEGIQNVTIKDLKEGNVTLNSNGWAYVDLDMIATGTSLKTMLKDVNPGTPVIGQIATAIKALPLDICAYNGVKIESLTEIYQIPVFYLATGQGPTYYGMNITNIRGMYVDSYASMDNINNRFQENITDVGVPSIDDLFGLANLSLLSNLTEPISNFMGDILDSGLIAPGYILAFSIDEVTNEPPVVSIIEPKDGSIVGDSELEITLNIQDNPDMVLWAEISIYNDGDNIFDTFLTEFDIPITTAILKNGNWSTSDPENQWWWDLVRDVYVDDGEYTIKVKVHDFSGYSLEVTRDFTVSDIPQIVNSNFNSIEWNPDGSYALIVGDGGVVARYDGNRVEVIARGLPDIPSPNTNNLQDISWHPDGNYALIVGGGNTIYKYDPDNILNPTYPFIKLNPILITFNNDWEVVSWKPGGSYALIASWGHLIKTTSSGVPIFPAINSNVWGTNDISWKPDGSYALIGGFLSPVRKFNGTTEAITNVDANNYHTKGIDWKPDGSYALVSSWGIDEDNIAYECDGSSMTGLGNGSWPSEIPYDVEWNPDGSYALIVGCNGALVLKYDEIAYSEVTEGFSTLKGPSNDEWDNHWWPEIYGVDWEPNGNSAIVVGEDGGVWLYSP